MTITVQSVTMVLAASIAIVTGGPAFGQLNGRRTDGPALGSPYVLPPYRCCPWPYPYGYGYGYGNAWGGDGGAPNTIVRVRPSVPHGVLLNGQWYY